jgi:sulfite reductase beta subunit-like hemoprotein
MTAPALTLPQRRGACPGLSAPMATGDGLLVRLLPIGTIALDTFAGLCAAARQHGNGIIEVTSRGSIQIRGLSAVSAPRLATAVATLGITAVDGIPVLTNPLVSMRSKSSIRQRSPRTCATLSHTARLPKDFQPKSRSRSMAAARSVSTVLPPTCACAPKLSMALRRFASASAATVKMPSPSAALPS